jgi:hypothetical protein
MVVPIPSSTQRAGRARGPLALIGLLLLLLIVVILQRVPASRATQAQVQAVPVIERNLSELLLEEGLLRDRNDPGIPFNGLMVESFPGGSIRSRSAVSNGLLEGLSEGFHTNAIRQIEEHFKGGVSHGLRTKWHSNGQLMSKAAVVEGELHGLYESWDAAGNRETWIEMSHGKPHGLSFAFFPSGYLKSRVELERGVAVSRQEWEETEREEPPPEISRLPGHP